MVAQRVINDVLVIGLANSGFRVPILPAFFQTRKLGFLDAENPGFRVYFRASIPCSCRTKHILHLAARDERKAQRLRMV